MADTNTVVVECADCGGTIPSTAPHHRVTTAQGISLFHIGCTDAAMAECREGESIRRIFSRKPPLRKPARGVKLTKGGATWEPNPNRARSARRVIEVNPSTERTQ